MPTSGSGSGTPASAPTNGRYASFDEFRDYLEQLPTHGLQVVTVVGSPTGGTFTLTYDGATTSAIAYNAAASVVETALRALSTLSGSQGDVKVFGAAGGPWEVWMSGRAGWSLMSATSSLTGGTSSGLSISNKTQSRIERILDRVTAIIDTELGYSFGDATLGTQVVYGDGTDFLVPPIFVANSITAVTAPSGYSVPDYVERDGMLVVTRGGNLYRRPDYGYPVYHPTLTYDDWYSSGYGWLRGVPYTVAATFGVADIPDDVNECCLEIAVRVWKARDGGFSDVVGVVGAGEQPYNRAYTALVQSLLNHRRVNRNPGVY